MDGGCLCPFESSLLPAQCALSGDDIIRVCTSFISRHVGVVGCADAYDLIESWIRRRERWTVCGNITYYHRGLSGPYLGCAGREEEVIDWKGDLPSHHAFLLVGRDTSQDMCP